MNSLIKLDLITILIEKLESGEISTLEHDYLQKTLTASILIQQYNNARHENVEPILTRYCNWLTNNYLSKNISPKIKMEYYLVKVEIEKFFHFFGVTGYKIKLPFEHLQAIAKIYNRLLERKKHSILKFLAFLMEETYNIPSFYIQDVFTLFQSKWRPILAPIALIPYKKFSLNEIEEYFFGGRSKQAFEAHVLPNADRLFSITNPQFTNHLFLPKRENFDIFEATLVVHEFQHIHDATQSPENSLFISEKNALNAERIFLNIVGTGKKGKFCWLESNLFYPLLLLEWELDIILSDTYNINNFYEICRKHGMEPLTLSPLFDWRAPFQMSAYCAASMHIETNWRNYMRDFNGVVL